MENNDFEKVMKDLMKGDDLSDFVVAKLSADDAVARTTITIIIDKYAAKIGRKSSEVWDEMYKAAILIHEKLGDYKGDEE